MKAKEHIQSLQNKARFLRLLTSS